MKKTFFYLLITAFVLTVILPACSSSEEEKAGVLDKLSESRENAAEAKNDLDKIENDSLTKMQIESANEWEKFKKESQRKINDNNTNLEKLKASIVSRHWDMRADYQKAIDNIQRKNEILKARLADFEQNKNESQNLFKQRFNNDINEVARSLKNMK